MRTLLLVLLALLAAGCNSMPKVTAVTESAGLGNTTILRSFNVFGAAAYYWPMADGKVVSGIFSNQYVSFDLAPGKHEIGVACCIALAPWLYDGLEIEVVEGKRRYFRLSPTIRGPGYAEIEEIPEEEATAWLARATRIKTGFISDCDGNPIEVSDSAPRQCFSGTTLAPRLR